MRKSESTNQKKKNHSTNRFVRAILRIMIASIIAIAFLALLVVAINVHVMVAAGEHIFLPDEVPVLDPDCILVLGAGVWPGGRPSPILEDRLKKGIILYEKGVAPKLLMSGDHGQPEYNEVGVMKQYAVNAGVPDDDVFMDHAGFSTYESMYRAKEVFGVDRMVIVTQRYHLYRAVYIANRLGIEAVGVASDQRSYKGQRYRDIREFFARFKDFILTVTKPEPTFLGEPISLLGSGNVTDDKGSAESYFS